MKQTASAPQTVSTKPDGPALAAFALVVVLAGANAVAVRFTVNELPPMWSAAFRFGAAALFFWVASAVRRNPLPRGRTLRGVLLYGVLNFGIGYGLIYLGIRDVGAGLTQVILALVPLLTLLFAVIHRLELFRLRALLGALLAVGGIAVIFVERPESALTPLSLLAVIASAACFAESIIIVKTFPPAPPLITNAVAMSAGTVALLLGSVLTGETRSLPVLPETWAAMAYLIIFGTVIVFYLSLIVIHRWTASATSYMFVLIPLITVILASWLADEPVTSSLLAGGALVILGVWVGALTWRRPNDL